MDAIKAWYAWTKARTPSFLVGGLAGFVTGFAVTKWNLISLVLSWI